MGRKNLLVEIERLLESDPSEKMRLSPRLLMMISDAGFYLSAVEAIDLVQPSVPTVYAEMETDEGKEGDASTLLSREVAIELRRHTQFKGQSIPALQFLHYIMLLPYHYCMCRG